MKKNSRTKLQIILAHTFTYFNMLNIALAGLIILSGQYKNMLFLGIVISNSLIGIIQELKVKKLIDALTVMTTDTARRIDSDGITEIPIEDLRMGDKIRLTAGDQIAADCTVISSSGMEVNESLLTGESVPVLKKEGDFLYSGSFITAGSGVGSIVHTGESNYAEQLMKKARTKKRASSEMQDAIKRIIRYVSYVIIPIGILLFCVQRFRAGETISDSLVNTVAGVLGMIPEGLVLLTSVSFILGVGRLARKRALVQEMEAIEALARVNVLCLDKTGTITTGELRVEQVIPCGSATEAEIGILISGILSAFSDRNTTSEALHAYFPSKTDLCVSDSIPFSSRRKYMGAAFRDRGNYVLGAPDILCATENGTEDLLHRADSYASEGYRVLLLASCRNLADTPEKLQEITPLAMILLTDCIKEDAADTFRFFTGQGVNIKVISGDNAATVSSAGMRAGIPGAQHYINAPSLPEDPEELQSVVNKYSVFGRVSPEMKQSIIKALQASGNVVGMVGDGINDVLSLKDADCGIAMANGAAAARQSAHIVLMDSDFSSMKDIVREGRTVIANIERVSSLYLTKTIYSVLLCLLFTILGKTYPFIPIQLSLIGGTAIGIPSFLLTLERHEEVTSSGFLRHVLRFSLPAAVTLTLSLIAIQFAGTFLHWDDAVVSTLNLLAGGAVSIGLVVAVCRPLNRRRAILCIGITALFLGALLLFPGFFNALPLL